MDNLDTYDEIEPAEPGDLSTMARCLLLLETIPGIITADVLERST